MGKRKVRMGIDVGGTHTKAVAIDNDTFEIIGKVQVPTTHDSEQGVAAGVVECFQKCLRDNNIAPEDVIFLAHSTTQATNALLEGDVARVGIIVTGGGGVSSLLAKAQTKLGRLPLVTGRYIETFSGSSDKERLSEETARAAVRALKAKGAEIIVASEVYGVDDGEGEAVIARAAKKAMKPLADYLGVSVEEAARQILSMACAKLVPVVEDLIAEYKLDSDQAVLVGCGGGAAALIPFMGQLMNIKYKIPENADVISSIGVALAMVRDTVERVIPNPTEADITAIRREAVESVIKLGAAPDSIETVVEIDNQKQRVSVSAMGSTEVKTTDMMKAVDEKEAEKIAVESFGNKGGKVELAGTTDAMYVYTQERFEKSVMRKRRVNHAVRVLDQKGFIKLQAARGTVVDSTIGSLDMDFRKLFDELSTYKGDVTICPDLFIVVGGRIIEVSGVSSMDQGIGIINAEINGMPAEEKSVMIGIRQAV